MFVLFGRRRCTPVAGNAFSLTMTRTAYFDKRQAYLPLRQWDHCRKTPKPDKKINPIKSAVYPPSAA
jgi:hypothetical protein